MYRQRRRISLALCFLLLVTITSTLYRPTPLSAGGGQPPVTLSLEPSSRTVQTGDTFATDVALQMVENSHAISTLSLIWNFDPSVLEATAMTPGEGLSFFQQLPPQPGVGRIGFTILIGTNAVQRSRTVATLNFRAVGSRGSSTIISWEKAEALSVSSWDGPTENVVGTATTASLCVGGCGQQTQATRIAFTTRRDGNAEIYTMNQDGTDQIRLTNNSSRDGSPNWSPDATLIAFDSERDGSSEIYIMNADGSHQTRLTHNLGSAYWPSWAPDGTKIAFFLVKNDNKGYFYVINPDGSNPHLLVDIPAQIYSPLRWSPDGTKIAFQANLRDFTSGISVINIDGSGFRRLTNYSSSNVTLDWSPDGNHITFAVNGNIYVMNADGSNQTRILDDANNNSDPAWSPDSRHIAFESFEGPGKSSIKVMNPDGSEQRSLTSNTTIDGNPAWARVPVPSDPSIDLEVTTIQPPQSPICAGSSPNFSAYIRNNGTVASGSFSIIWMISDGKSYDGGHNSIPPGEIDNHGHIWGSVPIGQHSLTFIADFDNQVIETNENNNQRNITVSVVDCSSIAYSISGNVYIDTNKNGVKDSDESNYAGATVALSGAATKTTATDTNGNYTFSDLQANSYTVTLTVPAEYYATTPDPVNISLNANTTVNFGIVRLPTVTPLHQVSGRVTDRDGRGLKGVRITAGNTVAETDSFGNYTLRDLPEGQWTLIPSKPDGDVVFTPASIAIILLSDESAQDFGAACEKSPTTGLDSCALLPGDLLLVRGKGQGFLGIDTVWAIERASYFHHVGMYTGNQEVTEAVGPFVPSADQIVTHSIEQTAWWSTDPVLDWAVIRPNKPLSKKIIIDKVKDWAKATDPIIGYAFSGRTDDTSFYCSKLVWRSYMLAEYDLEQPVWRVWGWTPDPLVIPSDLYNNRSSLVQQNFKVGDYIPATIAVGPLVATTATHSDASTAAATIATILVIDPQGRRSGFDPATDTTVSEIPDAIYSGTDAEVQNVSVTAIGTGWAVQVTGAAGGNFRVVADFPSVTPWQPQVIEGIVNPGETKTFAIIPPSRLYLPIVRH